MAMRLTAENVRFIEGQILDEISPWEGSEGEETKLLFYISGVHEMAQAVIKAIEGLGGKKNEQKS